MAEIILKYDGLVCQPGKKHIHKHLQDDLPLFPDDPAFTQLSPETLPSTSGSTSESLFLEVILERDKAAKQCLEEESKASSSLKHRVKQGPVKKSKKQRQVGFPNLPKSPLYLALIIYPPG